MTRVKTLDGKSYSGNPRGRSDEECLAPEVTQKCASALYGTRRSTWGTVPIEFQRTAWRALLQDAGEIVHGRALQNGVTSRTWCMGGMNIGKYKGNIGRTEAA